MEDAELKSNPAYLVQKRRRYKKSRRNEILKRYFSRNGKLECYFFWKENKRNEKNSETEQKGTKTNLQGRDPKRNETKWKK
jgi:hypothetical protein